MHENKVKVLVVEDEASIRRFITLNLETAGYEVGEAESGEDALALLTTFLPDLVVLDLMLPGMDGLEVCQHIRGTMPDPLIIMLTAKGQDTDKIMGLELGADDYMVKPFNPFELIARIKALLRRRDRYEPGRRAYTYGSLHLDTVANKLLKNNQEVELTPTEYSLLKMFMENPGKALRREEMLNAIWGEDYFGDTKTLDVHIRRLREKIEDNPSEPRHIKTIWGSGYRWQKETTGRLP
ncbi:MULTISPECIES: response regulator transcription factor [Desulfitobacterium]|uniref:Stage 0 sporulation protein A homolog n=1 Tax=Desulfitobacterium dehalogenans (strain ATCC 51507 / DSM 9161 / JW/IU-DC1) TaxID=756499 RepID=I4A873_DESDJ|nr:MULTISPECIES: response regulator transcription factor [Desulfitobacterium]AFM00158.1 response regulator with CheY-like receiver domain and winged-helix DNA-binding domain [Desulfitobacterium dehalogenans ATCC 51507]